MQILQFDPAQLTQAFGIQCRAALPPGAAESTPFGATWCYLKPGEQTERHNHYEGEVLFVASGQGCVEADGIERKLRSGDSLFLPPLRQHSVQNLSVREDLVLLSVYWGDPAQLAREERNRRVIRRPAHALVTATPPTPNGDLHIGHLSGPYLRADVHARYLRMRGVNAKYVSGIDSHQSYVARCAEQRGWKAAETAVHFGDRMRDTLVAANMEPALLARPEASAFHVPRVIDCFARLHQSGCLVERETASLHCDTCRRYLFEAHVRGTCPHCQKPTCGNACEDCGRPNDCVDIIDPKCQVCGQAPRRTSSRKLYFPLSRFTEALQRYWASCTMGPRLTGLCHQMLRDGLPDICLTHESDWGIPVPLAGYEGHTLYVWFEMAAGYLAAAEELSVSAPGAAAFRDAFSRDDCQVIQFYGFDNAYFHTILFPAIFLAYDPKLRPPIAHVVNEFYRLDGEKFSTSRNHAIWGGEFLRSEDPDHLRLHTARTGPEGDQTNFTRDDYQVTVAFLHDRLHGWLRALDDRLSAAAACAPEPASFDAEQAAYYGRLQGLVAEIGQAYEAGTFSLRRAFRGIEEIVLQANEFAAAQTKWQTAPGQERGRRTALALELVAARTLALVAAPLTPALSERLWRALGESAELECVHWEDEPAFLRTGTKISALSSVVHVQNSGAPL